MAAAARAATTALRHHHHRDRVRVTPQQRDAKPLGGSSAQGRGSGCQARPAACAPTGVPARAPPTVDARRARGGHSAEIRRCQATKQGTPRATSRRPGCDQESDVGALSRERLNDSATDPARTSDNHCRLALKLRAEHRMPTPFELGRHTHMRPRPRRRGVLSSTCGVSRLSRVTDRCSLVYGLADRNSPPARVSTERVVRPGAAALAVTAAAWAESCLACMLSLYQFG